MDRMEIENICVLFLLICTSNKIYMRIREILICKARAQNLEYLF